VRALFQVEGCGLLIVSLYGGEQRGEASSLRTHKGTDVIHEGSTLMSSCNPNYLPKASNIVILRSRVST